MNEIILHPLGCRKPKPRRRFRWKCNRDEATAIQLQNSKASGTSSDRSACVLNNPNNFQRAKAPGAALKQI